MRLSVRRYMCLCAANCRKRGSYERHSISETKTLGDHMSSADLLFSKDHEWLRIDGQTATVGITDHAQEELGEVVYVELPSVGAKFDSGETFGNVESVKAVSELFLPVSGEVTAINEKLGSEPEKINEDPYG